MKRRLRSKKGAAIEMALFFMVVTFALCGVITAISFSIRSKDKMMSTVTNDMFSIDQVGDDFVNMLRVGTGDTLTDEVKDEAEEAETRGDWMKMSNLDYGLCVDNKGDLFTLRVAEWSSISSSGNLNGGPTLIVTAKVTEDDVKVVNWSTSQNQYITPTVQEVDVERKPQNYSRNHSYNLWSILFRFFRNHGHVFRQGHGFHH